MTTPLYSVDNIQKNPSITFIDKFYDWIKNYNWRQGYDEVKQRYDSTSNPITKTDLINNSNYTLWTLIAHMHDLKVNNEKYFVNFGNNLYERIANFNKNLKDIEFCTLHSLYSIEKELGAIYPINYDIDAPLEIKELLNIFSINKSHLLTILNNTNYVQFKLTGPYDTWNSILPTSGILYESYYESDANEITLNVDTSYLRDNLDTFISTLSTHGVSDEELENNIIRKYNVLTKDSSISLEQAINDIVVANGVTKDEAYLTLIENIFKHCLSYYSGSIPSGYTTSTYDNYERLELSDFKDNRASSLTDYNDETILTIKNKYKVKPSFQLKFNAEQISNNLIDKSQFGYNEQLAIEEYLNTRKYSTQTSADELFSEKRKNKAKEYVAFIERLNKFNNGALLTSIEKLHDDYYTISDPDSFYFKNNCRELIENCSKILRNIAIESSYRRQYLKFVASKHSIIGTNNLIRSLISDFIARELTSPSSWRLNSEVTNFTDILSADTLKSIEQLDGIRILDSEFVGKIYIKEYWDSTEYFNIKVGSQTDSLLNERYWEGEELNNSVLSSEHTQSQIADFLKKAGIDETDDSSIMSFLYTVHNMGARTQTSQLLQRSDESLTDYNNRYMGTSTSDFPAGNIKNSINPSIAIIPFIYNLVSTYSFKTISGIKELLNIKISDLLATDYPGEIPIPSTAETFNQGLIDENGFTINSWLKHASDASAYVTKYEYSNNESKSGNVNYLVDYHGPYYPDALDYILNNNIVNSTANLTTFYNNYYASNLQDIVYTQSQLLEKLTAVDSNNDTVYEKYIGTATKTIKNKKIADYGVDNYGNEYFLFKTPTNYSDTEKVSIDFETSGEVWVKLKNHPIAMPVNVEFGIYDLSTSQQSGDLICATNCYVVNESDSQNEVTLNYTKIANVIENCHEMRVCNNYIMMYGLDDESKYTLLLLNISKIYDDSLGRYKFNFENSLNFYYKQFNVTAYTDNQFVGMEMYIDKLIFVTKQVVELDVTDYHPYRYDLRLSIYIIDTLINKIDEDLRNFNTPYSEYMYNSITAGRTSNYKLAIGDERISVAFEFEIDYSRELHRPYGGQFDINDLILGTSYELLTTPDGDYIFSNGNFLSLDTGTGTETELDLFGNHFYRNGICVIEYDFDYYKINDLIYSGHYIGCTKPSYLGINITDGVESDYDFNAAGNVILYPEDDSTGIKLITTETDGSYSYTNYDKTIKSSNIIKIQQFDNVNY